MTIIIRTRTKPQYHTDPAPVTVPDIAPTPVSLTAEQRQNMMTALFQAPIDDAGMTDTNAALNNLRAEISTLRAANARHVTDSAAARAIIAQLTARADAAETETAKTRDALAEANAILEDNYQRIAAQQQRIENLECQVLSAKVTL